MFVSSCFSGCETAGCDEISYHLLMYLTCSIHMLKDGQKKFALVQAYAKDDTMSRAAHLNLDFRAGTVENLW